MADEPTPPDLEINDAIPEGLKVTTEQPYRMLLVSDLAGSPQGSLSEAAADGPVAITAESFDEVMRSHGPSIRFTTSDPVASGNQMVELNLSFDSLKSFQPGNLLGQIPRTKSLQAVRERLVHRMLGKLSQAELSQAVITAVSEDDGLAWLQAALQWEPAEPASDTQLVDSVLGQLDLGGPADSEASPPPKTPIGAAVSAAADTGGGIPAEEASAVRRALVEIDRRMSCWLTAVLHAPQVRSLEAVWRSVAFFVSQIDFRKGVRLSLLHAHRDELIDRFTTLVIDPVFDEGVDAPDLIAVDAQFGQSSSDLETLDELAQHGASLPAVVLTNASPQFFGSKYAWQIATLPTIINVFDQWQFAKWKSLRDKPHARSLGVVFGRGQLREPYSRSDTDDLEFCYKEELLADKDLVWCGGSIVIGCTIAHSLSDIGWPTAMAGYVHGRIGGFKTATGGKKGDKKFGPSDTHLPEAKIEELGMAGINAAVGIRDSDEVVVWNGMTAARALGGDTSALLEVSLPYQLFAGRLSSLLFRLKPHLAGLAPDKIDELVTQHVRDWLPFEGEPTPEQVRVQTRPCEDDANALELAVTVTPPASVLPGEVPVVMGYRL